MLVLRDQVMVGAPLRISRDRFWCSPAPRSIAGLLALPGWAGCSVIPAFGARMSALLRCFRQTLRDIFRQKETLTLLVGASVLYSFFYPTPYLNQVLRDLPVVSSTGPYRVEPAAHSLARRERAARVSARSSDLSAAQDSVRAGVAGAVLLIPRISSAMS